MDGLPSGYRSAERISGAAPPLATPPRAGLDPCGGPVEIDLVQVLRASPELLLFVVLGVGYLVGKAGVGSMRLGAVAGVLVTGIAFGALGLVPESTRSYQMGFMLFIYSVGLQAGPRFFSIVLADGPRYLALVAVTSLSAVGALLWMQHQLGLSPALAAGVLAGALTSTPTLAAAQDAVRGGLAKPPEGTTASAMLEDVAVGYAISYLFGMIGLLVWVRLLPFLLRIDLAAHAAAYSDHMRLPEGGEAEGGIDKRWQPLVRTYLVKEGELTRGSLRELDLPDRFGCLIQQVRRDRELLPPSADLQLRVGDSLLVMGEVAAQQRFAEQLGTMTLDPELLDLPTEAREIVITSPGAAGRSIAELDMIHRFGCFVVGISRAQLELPVSPDLRVEKGDTLYAYGPVAGLEALARELGHTESKVFETDLLTFALGMAGGLFVGSIGLKIGSVQVGLGNAGGLLLSGILIGFLRSVHPTFGRVPRAARWVLMEFGLMVFMAGVGLRAGPTFLTTLGELGPSVVAAALVVLGLPFLLGTLFGLYALRLNPALVLGGMTGALTSTPALGLVNQLSRSSVPALGYAGTYAIANIVLAFAGGALVRL